MVATYKDKLTEQKLHVTLLTCNFIEIVYRVAPVWLKNISANCSKHWNLFIILRIMDAIQWVVVCTSIIEFDWDYMELQLLKVKSSVGCSRCVDQNVQRTCMCAWTKSCIVQPPISCQLWNQVKIWYMYTVIYQTWDDSVSCGYPHTEKRVENMMRSGVFLTKIWSVSKDSQGNTVSSVWYIFLIKQKLRSKWRSKIIKIYAN